MGVVLSEDHRESFATLHRACGKLADHVMMSDFFQY